MAEPARQLKTFWKPDGVNADPGNEMALKNWMRTHALSNQPGAITTFLYSPMHGAARTAAVASLIGPRPHGKKGSK